MTPALHPSAELLLDYATGQVDPASRTLVDAHLTYCEACWVVLHELALPGARQLEEAAADFAQEGLLVGILSRLKAPEPPRVGREPLPLPKALWPLLPDVTQVSWRGALTRGFRFLQVPQRGGPDLFLIHMEAGRSFPCHDHGGLERTLVLVGGLRDAQGVMEAGDFDEAPPGHVHAPVALPDEDCWLLATLEGDIRLRGWRGLLQRVVG